MRRQTKLSSGFTIIELLIATVVLSFFLLLLTQVAINISRTYTRGLTASKTQEAARSILSDIERSIKLNSGPISETPSPVTAGNTYSFCAGSRGYTYIPGRQLTDDAPSADQSKHVLVVGSTCTPSTNMSGTLDPVSEKELMPVNLRLAKLEVKGVAGSSSFYRVTVRVVSGDKDLLCSPIAGDCGSTTDSTNLGNDDLACKQFRGSEYCAASELVVDVMKRL